jgi:hypothetical protein
LYEAVTKWYAAVPRGQLGHGGAQERLIDDNDNDDDGDEG